MELIKRRMVISLSIGKKCILFYLFIYLGLKMHIHKNSDLSIEEGDSLNCPLIVNNNHVSKNKKTKLRCKL